MGVTFSLPGVAGLLISTLPILSRLVSKPNFLPVSTSHAEIFSSFLEGRYNYITYNMDVLQGHGGMMQGHLVSSDLTCKINNKHALRLELQHLYTKEDKGSWLYGMLEYSISPNWFISVGDQWNYGNSDKSHRIHYYNISAAYVWHTTRIALNFGKTREGVLCIGGVCRSVPASYGMGLSVTTSF